jgi:hypothetical protein
MKAEQRKELETNTLADKVGQAMQRVKGSSRRSAIIYFLVGVALLIALFFAYRWYDLSKKENSLAWLMFDDGSQDHLLQLQKLESPAGRAARFQIAWILYWEEGVRMIGVNPPGALKALKEASVRYEALAKECAEADDKIFEPQALLGVAVCEETRAVQDLALLTQAKASYAKILSVHDGKYKESAAGIFAQKRLDQMNDKTKLKEMELVYEELQKSLQVPGAMRGGDLGLPPGIFLPPKGKGDKDN